MKVDSLIESSALQTGSVLSTKSKETPKLDGSRGFAGIFGNSSMADYASGSTAARRNKNLNILD